MSILCIRLFGKLDVRYGKRVLTDLHVCKVQELFRRRAETPGCRARSTVWRMMTTDMTTVQECSADFTLDGQSDNYKAAVGVAVALQANDTEATTYQWQVTSSPPGCDYQLTGEAQAQATLTPQETGAYLIQLTVTKGECEDLARHILWAETAHRQYRLPATREPLAFSGDEEWAGDLVQVIRDVDGSLPTDDQKAAMDAADAPTGTNPFVTSSQRVIR
jgi:hypothetical protein